MMAARPAPSIPGKTCAPAAAAMASTATWTSPSVEFLNPMGMERPLASWRWIWLCEVRAPIAPQLTVSAKYWGVIGSRNSHPTGIPRAMTSSRKDRAANSPSLTRKLPSSPGSLIRPFHPTVVRGFSK